MSPLNPGFEIHNSSREKAKTQEGREKVRERLDILCDHTSAVLTVSAFVSTHL